MFGNDIGVRVTNKVIADYGHIIPVSPAVDLAGWSTLLYVNSEPGI